MGFNWLLFLFPWGPTVGLFLLKAGLSVLRLPGFHHTKPNVFCLNNFSVWGLNYLSFPLSVFLWQVKCKYLKILFKYSHPLGMVYMLMCHFRSCRMVVPRNFWDSALMTVDPWMSSGGGGEGFFLLKSTTSCRLFSPAKIRNDGMKNNESSEIANDSNCVTGITQLKTPALFEV